MIKCEVKQKTSKKGNSYVCLEVTFPNGYTKTCFLDKAEEFMALQFINDDDEIELPY